MYFIIPLILASAVLGLPHQIRNPSNSVLALDAGACPGAPPVPSGAHPSDGCDGAPLTTRSPAVSRRGQMRKRQDTSSCQVVTLAQYQTSPMKAGIEAIATKDWGGISLLSFSMHPADITYMALHFCYLSGTIPATLNKPPTCQVSRPFISDFRLSVPQHLPPLRYFRNTFRPSDISYILPIVLFPCSFDSITRTHRTRFIVHKNHISGHPCNSLSDMFSRPLVLCHCSTLP
ncbi:hypothetical protein JB92DRAFT_491624 [Gautieria morchelliformis]|nr:hypothetical protein JB92DRAFT_491624 [Gautieria morchelliformis]